MSDETPSQKFIGYDEFRYICFFNEKSSKGTNDFGGYELRRDGLFLLPLVHIETLLEGELAVLTGDSVQPALVFPCTLPELRSFVAGNGFLGCIDEDNLREVLAAKAKSPRPFDQGESLKKNELIKRYENIWSTIKRDLNEAPDNGLLEAGQAIEYGYWVVDRCLAWARTRGKLCENRPTPAAPATPFTGLGSLSNR